MESWWSYLVARCSPFTLFVVVPTVAVNLVYAAATLVCMSFDRVPRLQQYKVQSRYNGKDALWRCVKTLVLVKLLVEIPMTAAAYPMLRKIGISYESPLPAAWHLMWQIPVFFFFEDAWHYFAHRLLHTRWGYQKIHYMHHEYSTPIGVAANYAHPLETMILGFGTVLPILIFRPHLSTLIFWICIRQLQAVAVHCGYDFPWRLGRFLPLVHGARFHDRHHTRYNRNYAPLFTYLDDWFGTADHGERRARS